MAEATQLMLILLCGSATGVGLLILAVRSWALIFDLPFATVLGPVAPLFRLVISGLALLTLVVLIMTTRNRKLTGGELRRE